jgi:gluconate/galactonate dehydratase
MSTQDFRDVEITDVQTTQVGGNYAWTLVRIYTDAGVAGTGEAYWGAGVTDIVHRLAPVLEGENPCDIDRLYSTMISALSGEGSIGGTPVTAVSGIEIALHDLAGKILGVPAYQLLGGKYRDAVRVYCDLHAGEDPEDPESYADKAETVLAEGWDAIKFDLDASDAREGRGEWNRHLSDEGVREKVDIVRAVTERVGDRADVAFDCHWNWTGDTTRRLAVEIEPCDVLWLEDPVPPENHDVQETVTKNTNTTICAGENVYRKHGTRQLIEEEAVDVIQPDMPKVGGMRETAKIADAADTYYIPLALHNVSSPLGTVAGAHVAAAAPNFLALEYHARDVDWWGDVVEEDVLSEGRIEVPDEPGLGVTLDRDVVEAHMVEGETLFDPA